MSTNYLERRFLKPLASIEICRGLWLTKISWASRFTRGNCLTKKFKKTPDRRTILIFQALPVWIGTSGTFRIWFSTKYKLFRQKHEIKSNFLKIGLKSFVFWALPVQNCYFRFHLYTSDNQIFQYDTISSKNHQTSLKSLVFKALPVWNRYFRFWFHTKDIKFS